MATPRVNGGAQRYYILATAVAVPEHTLVLKQDETFGVFNDFGDIDAGARHEEGLYREGTRHLSHLELRLAQGRPHLLSSAVRRDNLVLSVDLTNPDIWLKGRITLPRALLHIYRSKFLLDGVCHERIHVRNFGAARVDVDLALHFAADFRDIFEVRGETRARRGRLLEPRLLETGVELAYQGLDGVERRTRIECDRRPAAVSGSDLQLALVLPPGGEAHYGFTIACGSGRAGVSGTFPGPAPRPDHDAALAVAERGRQREEGIVLGIETDNDQMNAWLQRGVADLDMLLTQTPQGLYPYAGVPWFDTPFGRDGLITAREVLGIAPGVARAVLAFLAATQASAVDPASDAEPGKILHEARQGEMAALGEIPFGRYYGSVDATPLFVLLAGDYFRRSGDLPFLRGIWRNVLAALEWIDGPGDADRDGFVEYARRSPQGLVQQGWKDSHDAVFHADGALAEGPIALCEVQGYVYQAKLGAAGIAAALGADELADRLRDQAGALRERFQQAFWCEEIGTYALALDGAKRPCRVRTSNPGHCLWTGIARPEHAARIAEAFAGPGFFNGWGVRTVANTEARYNPMSYHNGSIWPHDNAIVAAGVARYGFKGVAVKLLSAQLDASTYVDLQRLPELFCGFERRPGKAPTRYPVACSPQAWSAGSPFLLLEACLGLTLDAVRGRITLHHPLLPDSIDAMRIAGLVVGEAVVDLELHRHQDSVSVNVHRRRGQVEVVVLS